ncbi:hypothetical protein [Silvibacterium acidisoli]|uniref:hypothetical protein n=1 Tax=Acidobacteriaceae bacterium ZG23-2 TaxID=2883246 RepID=UPI00406C973B
MRKIIVWMFSAAFCLTLSPSPIWAQGDLGKAPSIYWRVGAGIDVTAASSSNPTGRLMGDLAVQIPVHFGCATEPCDNYLTKHWFDGYLRVDSISQPGAISGLSNASSYLTSVTSLAPEQAVYSLESQIGYDFDLLPESKTIHTRPYLSVQAGAITPLSANQSNPTVYELTSAIESAYPAPKGSGGETAYEESCPNGQASGPNQQLSYGQTECYVAFLPQDRDRFYRYYQAGFRLKHFAYDSEAKEQHYPSVFEVEVGQNDYVTGGSLRGPVAHFGGATYLPPIHGVYLFGSMDVGFQGARTHDAVLLTVPSSPVSIAAPNVAVLSSPQPNRDRWRLGISFDIAEFLKDKKGNGQ